MGRKLGDITNNWESKWEKPLRLRQKYEDIQNVQQQKEALEIQMEIYFGRTNLFWSAQRMY